MTIRAGLEKELDACGEAYEALGAWLDLHGESQEPPLSLRRACEAARIALAARTRELDLADAAAMSRAQEAAAERSAVSSRTRRQKKPLPPPLPKFRKPSTWGGGRSVIQNELPRRRSDL